MAHDNAPRTGEEFFAPVRGSLATIIALSVLGAVSSVVPFIAIVELARALLPALAGEAVDAARVWLIVIVAAIALFVTFGAAFTSGMVAHLADAELQLSLRQRIIRHLQRLPLGWFDARTSGTVRKMVEDDVNSLHQLVAHAIQDLTVAIAVPVLSIGYLLAVQWQLALAAVLPLVVTVVLYAVAMRGGAERFQEYDAATERLSGATVEFVHGIAVVKRFGQTGRSHRRYRDETGQYVRFIGRWTRETSVLTSVIEIVTSPVVVLVYLLAVGLALVNAGLAQPIDLLPGVLLGLGLSEPLMKLGTSAQFLRNAMKAQESLAGFFAVPPVAEPATPVRPDGHDIVTDEVTFSYDGAHRVLQDIADLPAGHRHRAGRLIGLREVHPRAARPQVLRRRRRIRRDRRCRCARGRGRTAVPRGRLRVPGRPAVGGQPARQHPADPAVRERRRGRARRPGRADPRPDPAFRPRLRRRCRR